MSRTTEEQCISMWGVKAKFI